MLLDKLAIFLSLFLFSCSINSVSSKQIIPAELYCDTTIGQFIKSNKNFIDIKNKNFQKILTKINPSFKNKKYNLIIVSDAKPSAGYSLEFKNVIKKNNVYHLNFNDVKPSKNFIGSFAVTYTYCLLKIDNLEKFKVNIK